LQRSAFLKEKKSCPFLSPFILHGTCNLPIITGAVIFFSDAHLRGDPDYIRDSKSSYNESCSRGVGDESVKKQCLIKYQNQTKGMFALTFSSYPLQ
jgi:hypothetical protein